MSLLKMITLFLSSIAGFLVLIFIWTDLITGKLLAKLLISLLVINILSLVFYLVNKTNDEKKLKKDGFLIE